MTTQTEQPIERVSVTFTVTPEEQDLLLYSIFCLKIFPEATALHKKLQFLFPNSGDACRHPVQSPDAVGQGGTVCYQCEKTVSYFFDDARCKDCTRLTPEEVQGFNGQGGNQ